MGSITTGGATVSGNVNPNNVATTYKVEYGTTVAYGSATTPVSAGSGGSAVAASVPLTGLVSSTTYHARLVAQSAGGTTNGPDLVFTTGDLPPSVSGTAFGSVTPSTATISGDVNPNRVATTYRVEYGTTILYGSVTSWTPAGSGSSAVSVSVRPDGPDVDDDLPRAAGRDERGRDDERPGPRLHDGGPAAVGLGHVGRVGHDERRDGVGEREPQSRRDELQRRVRHDGGVRLGDDAGLRRVSGRARSRRACR